MLRRYKIFGKHVHIIVHDEKNNILNDIIDSHFGLYEKIENTNTPDLIIHVLKDDIAEEPKAINPKIHIELDKGFKSIAPKISVAFKKEEILTAYISLEKQNNRLIGYLKKLNNKQYSSIDERISQVIYELVLVPSVYFDEDNFLVHSSAFKKKGRGAVLIGGTGGVGKTSLEIELCMNRAYSFIADDISVISKDSFIWPNLSFPKIYAYNLQDNEKLRTQIFKKRSWHDKLAWRFKYFISGPAGVRRTVSPTEAYGNYEKNKSEIDKYYILIKKNVEEIQLEKIDGKQAAEMTLSIIQTEYASFNNHILWHEFNNRALNETPILKLDTVFERWAKESKKVLNGIDCYIINIPLEIDHKTFTRDVADIIDQ
jgi:hypothetical protein